MNDQQAKEIEDWYHVYVGRFQVNGTLPPMQLLKYDHSMRVAREAMDLARELGWQAQNLHLLWITSILHDIGRFSQFAEYGTFSDRESINHAARGAKVLLAENTLKNLYEEDRQTILDGVRYHNCKMIPSGLSCPSMNILKLVRDADKLDIFWVLLDALQTEKVHEHPEYLLGLRADGKANPKHVRNVCQGKMISTAEIECLADLLLLQIGWIFDINHEATMRHIRDRRFLEQISAFRAEDEGIRCAVKAAVEYRDKKLAAHPDSMEGTCKATRKSKRLGKEDAV
ncbi:MAG: HD domain-containing protein [Candidatus Omnitrophica bacterium]|nr:HD domain-containing protein [Candidatus Omnitrophota bacterium]